MKDIDRMILEFGRNSYPAVVEVDGMTDEQLRAIQLLACVGLVESFGMYGGYRITNAGMDALRAEEDRLQNKEEQRSEEEAAKQEERAYLDEQTEKKFRHDWRITIFSLIGGFILGVVSDHFLDIVGYCSGFFRALFK